MTVGLLVDLMVEVLHGHLEVVNQLVVVVVLLTLELIVIQYILV